MSLNRADRTVRDAGGTPHPWSKLSEDMRSAAEGWFALHDLDAVLAARGR